MDSIQMGHTGTAKVVLNGIGTAPQWSVDDTSIATVTPGATADADNFSATITPVAPGTTVLRFSCTNHSQSNAITINDQFVVVEADATGAISLGITQN